MALNGHFMLLHGLDNLVYDVFIPKYTNGISNKKVFDNKVVETKPLVFFITK